MTTIGEPLKARIFKAKAIGFAFWLLFAAAFFLPMGSVLQPLMLVPFVGFAGSVLYILVFVKCPECGKRRGSAIAASTSRSVSFDSNV
jgi:hypothetical protein